MIEKVLRYLNNFFISSWAEGVKIEADGITVDDAHGYLPGQYIYVVASVLNDGVHEIASVEGNKIAVVGALETEEGTPFVVYGLRVPKQVRDLAAEIAEFNLKTGVGVSSESLGDYKVSYGASSSGRTGWAVAYADSLAPFRKPYLETPRFVQTKRRSR